MNWDAVGAIGEIVGAIAVVATLGYLAVQIRLGRIASEIQSTYASHESYSRWRVAMMGTPELAKLVAKVNRAESVEEDERILLTALTNELVIGATVSAATNRRSNLFYDVAGEVAYLVGVLTDNPGLIPYWHNAKKIVRDVDREFIDTVDNRVPKYEDESGVKS